MSKLWCGFLRWRWRAAGLGLVVAFATLAGRFWHPYFGFMKFAQLDEHDARSGISEVRAPRLGSASTTGRVRGTSALPCMGSR